MNHAELLDEIKGKWILVDIQRFCKTSNEPIYLAQCECSRTREVRKSVWKKKSDLTCICDKERKYLNKKSGRLTVTKVIHKNRRTKLIVVCECGTVKEIETNRLGYYKSCGCWKKEHCRRIAKKV